MAEILCPVCGRANPVEQETCRYCGTVLATGPAGASQEGRSDLPEWLQDFRLDEEEAAPAAGEEPGNAGQPFETDAESQAWLDRLEDQSESGEPAVDLPTSTQAGAEEPGWLQRIRRRKDDESLEGEVDSQAGEAASPLSSDAEGETPDWLRLSDEATQAGEEPAEPQEGGEGKSEPLPDWMLEESGEAEEEFDLEPPAEPAGELPDWLQSAQPGEVQPQVSEEPPAETSTTPGLGPVMMYPVKDTGAEVQAPHQVHAEQPLSTDEVSAWLSSEPAAEGEAPADGEGAEELAAAELPGWLEAMRPVEGLPPTPAPAEQPPEQPESAGPLAGLRRVLSAEPDAARVQKPAAYSVKLQVSDSQQAHIEQLKQMVETEGEAKPLVFRRAISSQHLLRIAIAVLLFMAVLWPLLNNSQSSPLPLLSPEASEFYQIINKLPDQARVLVGFDYEPSVAGELDATASTVLDHLMLKGAYLTLVSTTQAGPIMGERLIHNTLAGHNYSAGNQYIDLGYISGGTTGLSGFVASPQRIAPLTLDGKSAWERPGRTALPPLTGVNRLSDFALVLVITENPDTARAWIEQVQPYLSGDAGQTPLLVIASAQAEPLVRPYYSATPKQVQGLLVGLQGGAAYSLQTGQAGLPRLYWDAFGMGLAAATGLIVVGGLISLIAFGISSTEKTQVAKGVRSLNTPTGPVKREGPV